MVKMDKLREFIFKSRKKDYVTTYRYLTLLDILEEVRQDTSIVVHFAGFLLLSWLEEG